MGDRITFAQREIGKLQHQVERRELTKELLRHEENMHPGSNAKQWAYYDGLKAQLSYLKEAEKELEDTPFRRKRWLDSFKIMLYKWATRERFASEG